MDESALEWYFDHFIANDSLMQEEEEEEEEVNEELGDELFLSLLPDELLTLYESRQDDAGTESNQTAENESRTVNVLSDSCTSLNYSSQNSTAVAELPGGSSMPKPDASPVRPTVTQKPEIVPQIQNVISTVKLGCSLDLDFIACKARNVEYNPKAYKALIMRIREPRTTAVIYQSGNMVCTGAKSEEQSRLAARKYARIVQKLGFPVCVLNFQIQNLVASCNTFPLSLDRMALKERCSYEPELFPGLHYNVMPGITATIFSSGKMSFSGAKKEAEIYKAFDTIYPILSCYRRQ